MPASDHHEYDFVSSSITEHSTQITDVTAVQCKLTVLPQLCKVLITGCVSLDLLATLPGLVVSTLTWSTVSNLKQVANLLCAQANSASYPKQDGKCV